MDAGLSVTVARVSGPQPQEERKAGQKKTAEEAAQEVQEEGKPSVGLAAAHALTK